MCDLCMQEPCAWGCPNHTFVPPHPVCSWCQNPIIESYHYDIDGDVVCQECIEGCRRSSCDW